MIFVYLLASFAPQIIGVFDGNNAIFVSGGAMMKWEISSLGFGSVGLSWGVLETS